MAASSRHSDDDDDDVVEDFKITDGVFQFFCLVLFSFFSLFVHFFFDGKYCS